MNLIPVKYRLLAQVVALLASLAASALAGAVVNGWRLEGAHEEALRAKETAYGALKDKVGEQNLAVGVLSARAEEAEKRRALAQTYAESVLGQIGSRSAAVMASKAADCDGVLREAWQ